MGDVEVGQGEWGGGGEYRNSVEDGWGHRNQLQLKAGKIKEIVLESPTPTASQHQRGGCDDPWIIEVPGAAAGQ